MARYDAQHMQDTRRRIIETAAKRFETDGIDGSGVATLMKDADIAVLDRAVDDVLAIVGGSAA